VKTVTLRNLPPALARAIRRRADEDGTSLARAVIALLEERLRLSGPAQRRVYHDLDELAGSWTDEEAAAFEGALADQRRIDTGLWE
jgi:hypothetical protein